VVPDTEAILGFKDACEALDLYTEDQWREAKAEAKRLAALKQPTPLSTAIRVMCQEIGEYLSDRWRSDACVKRLRPRAGDAVYPDYADTTPECRALQGRRWIPEALAFKTMTLHEHQTTLERKASSLLIAGPAQLGKSTLLHTLAKAACIGRGLDMYGWCKAIDPLGLLTKSGLMAKFAAVCVTDFDMVSCLNTALSPEDMKSLFDVREGGSCPARYHRVEWQKKVPKFFAVNYNSAAPASEHDWMARNGCDWMRLAIRGDVAGMTRQSFDVQAMAARVTIFALPAGTMLITPAGIQAMADDDQAEFDEEERRKAAYHASQRRA
jgi:hypothetical protein